MGARAACTRATQFRPARVVPQSFDWLRTRASKTTESRAHSTPAPVHASLIILQDNIQNGAFFLVCACSCACAEQGRDVGGRHVQESGASSTTARSAAARSSTRSSGTTRRRTAHLTALPAASASSPRTQRSCAVCSTAMLLSPDLSGHPSRASDACRPPCTDGRCVPMLFLADARGSSTRAPCRQPLRRRK